MKIKPEDSLFFPSELAGNVFSILDNCQRKAENIPLELLLSEAREHLEQAHQAHARNGVVNVRIAEAIYNVFEVIVADWDNIPFQAQTWCKGMISYFSLKDDDEDDFNSLIGFDDDVEVVNSCLVIARREDLSIKLGDAKELPVPETESPSRRRTKPGYSSAKVPLAAGMRVLCRDAEWLVTGVETIDPASLETGKETNSQAHCTGVDDLVYRGQFF